MVAKAAHDVAPQCRMGFQQLGHEAFMYSGPDWSPVLKTLARHSGHPVRARLGHGCYADHAPRQMVHKAFMISRQIGRLPDCVDQICPEIEGYNHNALGKSAHGFAVESALDLAVGCNSLSYALLCSGHEPMAWYGKLLDRLAAHRAFLEEYAECNRGACPGGLELRLGSKHVAGRSDFGKPFAWASVNLEDAQALAFYGVPLCGSMSGASGVLLTAQAVDGLGAGELRDILSGGVMMDGAAAQRVQERGLGRWLGVRVTAIAAPIGVRERITGERLNGRYRGRPWESIGNVSGAFRLDAWPGSRPRILGHYEDRFEKPEGTATLLCRNAVGGRVAIFGYFGWEHAPSGAKRNQYLVAADWVSRGRLPARIDEPVPVVVLPRVRKDGSVISVALLNASIDRSDRFMIRIRTNGVGRFEWVLPGRCPQCLPAEKSMNGTVTIFMPSIPAWTLGYLRLRS